MLKKKSKIQKFKLSIFQKLQAPKLKLKPGLGSNFLTLLGNKVKEIDDLFSNNIEYKEIMTRTFSYNNKNRKSFLNYSNNENEIKEKEDDNPFYQIKNKTSQNYFTNKNNFSRNYGNKKHINRIIKSNNETNKINNKTMPLIINTNLNNNNMPSINITQDTSSLTPSNINLCDNLFEENYKINTSNNLFLTSFKDNKSNSNIKSRNIRLKLNNKNLPKKLLDFSSINLSQTKNDFSNDKKKGKTERKITSISIDEKKLKTQLLKKKILDIEEKGPNIKLGLKELLKEWHFFPLVTPSFQTDIDDIIDKKINIYKNGTYDFQTLYDNKKFLQVFNNYWKYVEEKKINEKNLAQQKKELQYIKNKIRRDILNSNFNLGININQIS